MYCIMQSSMVRASLRSRQTEFMHYKIQYDQDDEPWGASFPAVLIKCLAELLCPSMLCIQIQQV